MLEDAPGGHTAAGHSLGPSHAQVAALGPLSAACGISTKFCDLWSFPRTNTLTPNRTNTLTRGDVTAGQTPSLRTSSTDQVVRTDKYVQAGGLFIS